MENDNNIKIKVGSRIKYLRNEMGLTQEQLANKLPNVKLKLCEIFNCTLDYLMCKSDIRNPEKEEYNYAYHKEAEGLTDEEISDALRFYKEMKDKMNNKKEK